MICSAMITLFNLNQNNQLADYSQLNLKKIKSKAITHSSYNQSDLQLMIVKKKGKLFIIIMSYFL